LSSLKPLCKLSHMATNLAIDDRLIEQAVKLSGHRTKKAAVTEALREYIHRRKQARIVRLFGKIDIDKTYDYKRARKRS
jgi:Arc/MetJ family transcription regulator